MSDANTVQPTGKEGSGYSVEVISPEQDGYGAMYGVELVRASTDRQGLEHEQRLRLGEYSAWASAEEHQREVETALERDGLDGLGEDARRVAHMPYQDGQYLAMVFPNDDSAGDTAKVHLLYLSGQQVTAALIANGRTEDMETLCGRLDRVWAKGGNEHLLDTAQQEAEARGHLAPGTALFDATLQPNLTEDLPFTFGAGLQPFDAQGVGQTHHIDGGGTAHWFAVVESGQPETEPYELRYFRAIEADDGSLQHDSYAVMPLTDDDHGSAWPLPSLEMYLQRGDLYMAQQLAHDVADHHGQTFPNPLDMPALDPHPEYYFGYGIGPNTQPSLEAVKTWMHGSERRFDTFTIAEYGAWDDAQADERELENTLKATGLEAAMNHAERIATANGYLAADRTDPRVFFEDQAPSDPFTTERGRAMERDMQSDEERLDLTPEQAVTETDTQLAVPVSFEAEVTGASTTLEDVMAEADRKRDAHASLEGAAWFEATFEGTAELLRPIHDTVNYGVVVQAVDPWTIELSVEKYWREPNGYLGLQSITLEDYDSDDGRSRGEAEQARDALLDVYDQRGLGAMMHKAELTAMQNDWIDGDRADPNLFTQGPPDRFETLAQQLQGEPNPYGNTDGEKLEDPEPPAHYWQVQHRPAQTPDGQPLGVALFVTEFPDLPPDFDALVERDGMDDSLYPSRARTLEMAHFTDAAEARKFEAEFRGYLIPGLLDGPELAPEVAKLEGLSGEWQVMTERDIIESMEPNRAVVRQPHDWHPYNPHAERDARIAAEGVYYDPIQQLTDRDEPEAQPDTPTLER